MSFNIVDLVKGHLGESLLAQMGKVLGTDGSKTSIAVGGALPGLLSGLTGVTSKPGGAETLFETLRAHDDSRLDDMSNLLGGGDDTSRVIDEGNSALERLFGGDALGKLGGVLASFAGLSRSGSGSLMGMLAPVVLGALKRRIGEGGLDASGLSSMLGEQRSNIDAAMPQGLAGQLQSEGFFDSIAPGRTASAQTESSAHAEPPPSASTSPTEPAPAGTAPPAAAAAHTSAPPPADPPAENKSGGLPGWVLPVAAVAVLAVLGWLLFAGGDAEEAAEEAVSATGEAATEVTEAAEQTVAEVDAELPEGMKVDQFTDAVDEVTGSAASTLEGITDEASARAALPDLKDANTKLNTLSENVARLPEAARGPIGAAVTAALEKLRPTVDRVLGMPAVGPVVEPVVAPMVETLEGLAS